MAPPKYTPIPEGNTERILAHLEAEDREIEVSERVIASLSSNIKGLQMALDQRRAQRSAFIASFCIEAEQD